MVHYKHCFSEIGYVNTVYSTMQRNLLYKPKSTEITRLHFLKYKKVVTNKYINIHIYGVPNFRIISCCSDQNVIKVMLKVSQFYVF